LRTPIYKTGGPWRNLQIPEDTNKVDSEKDLAQSNCHDDGQIDNCKPIDDDSTNYCHNYNYDHNYNHHGNNNNSFADSFQLLRF
jgi:hypothetical protein